tara:strand:- start:74 stop:292 length:219 start_codon:yes stop_codon:yes gene_type:complete
MNVQVGITVSLANFWVVHLIQPVIGNYLASGIQNQATKGVTLVGVGVYSPIATMKVFTDRGRYIQQGWVGSF